MYRPYERVIGDRAQLHEGVVDLLQSLGGSGALTGFYLTLNETAQSQLVC
jgi:hypothetical protein